MKRAIPPSPIMPVILAGGDGLRLAPISTPEQPKPFVPLPDGRSLLTRTLERCALLDALLPPLLVGQGKHRYALHNHVRAAGCQPMDMLLEPEAKNTAMAIAVAAHYAMKHRPGATMVIVPADQIIASPESWMHAVFEAVEVSQRYDRLCLLGVTPTHPDRNYGYIRPGKKLPDGKAFAVERFIEKPDQPEHFMEDCLWNAGQFVAPPACIAQLFMAHAPRLWQAAGLALQEAHAEHEFIRLNDASYRGVAAHSFDRMVVEAAESLVVRLETPWHDLGTLETWQAYTGQSVASASQRPPRVDRPWGYYELLYDAPQRCEKRLVIYPGCRLSLQRHARRDEHWKILEGCASITFEGKALRRDPGAEITIPAMAWHRLQNDGKIPLIIHEIQTGMPDESDIERREDDYGR
jgi:mannose-1-phosphate guanylyltransferase/mannose-6-phosphate isomerase-like protein (cupin superfamily)